MIFFNTLYNSYRQDIYGEKLYDHVSMKKVYWFNQSNKLRYKIDPRDEKFIQVDQRTHKYLKGYLINV